MTNQKITNEQLEQRVRKLERNVVTWGEVIFLLILIGAILLAAGSR